MLSDAMIAEKRNSCIEMWGLENVREIGKITSKKPSYAGRLYAAERKVKKHVHVFTPHIKKFRVLLLEDSEPTGEWSHPHRLLNMYDTSYSLSSYLDFLYDEKEDKFVRLKALLYLNYIDVAINTLKKAEVTQTYEFHNYTEYAGWYKEIRTLKLSPYRTVTLEINGLWKDVWIGRYFEENGSEKELRPISCYAKLIR